MNYKRKLSLAVIYGNVETTMGRFLRSFAPLVDEVILVRAIGNKQPDESMCIAVSALDSPMGKFVRFAEYKNAEGNDWPHVDNFAAARQMAFDLASNEWVMWADTDDILNPAFIPIIRTALDGLPEGTVGIQFPYEVPEDRLTVMRERIVRKDTFKWHSPIHECLMPLRDDLHMGSLNNVKITHMPTNERKPHDERNLRILESIPKDELTRSQKFHLAQSLSAVGRKEEAAVLAVETLQSDTEMEPPERMQLLFTASEAAPPEIRSQLMLQAVALDPTRREPYGELVLNALQRQQPREMIGWSRAMMAQPIPQDLPWNAQRRYWGWLGVQLEGMALRFNNDTAGADVREINHFLASGAKISLLHATRGRPVQASRARKMWLDRAENGDAIEHIFAIDADDELVLATLSVFRHIVVQPGGGCVRAWNAAAEVSRGQVLIQVSDDWEPPMHWDKLILERLGDLNEPKVLAVSDGHRTDDLLCMAILTRTRYLDQGYLFHPDFFSMFSDNWFSECAHRDGVVIDARDLVFEHQHPLFVKEGAEWDEVYARSNSDVNYSAGARHLQRLRDGVITSHDVEGWCNYRTFYTQCAAEIPPWGSFVEIGSWMGQSIIHLAQRLQDLGKDDVKIYCVDTFKGEEGQTAHIPTIEAHGGSIRHVFVANIKAAGVDGMIEIVDGDSAESASRFADASLDGCYIDAAHDYKSVVKDLAAWHPKVKAGGIFSGHDYPWHEVRRAVDEWALETGHVIEQIGSVWVTKS